MQRQERLGSNISSFETAADFQELTLAVIGAVREDSVGIGA